MEQSSTLTSLEYNVPLPSWRTQALQDYGFHYYRFHYQVLGYNNCHINASQRGELTGFSEKRFRDGTLLIAGDGDLRCLAEWQS